MANAAVTGNKLMGQATVVATATVSVSLADLQMPGETLTGIRVKRVFFSGNVAVGNSTVNFMVANGTDHWAFDQYAAATPVLNGLTVTVASGGCAILTLDKIGTLDPATAAADTNFMVNP